MPAATGDSSDTGRLLERVRCGDRGAWNDLLARHQRRLLAVVRLRIDRRLGGRVSPSDMVQEAFLDAAPGRRVRLRLWALRAGARRAA